MTIAEMTKGAVISDCGRYRYALVRRWAQDGRIATFVMLNPSTADAEVDDPTILRCIGFARRWGCNSMHVVNLYALRSKDPKALWAAEDPVGPENDRYLASHGMAAASAGHLLVAAWGANAKADRVEQVLQLPGFNTKLMCLGTTKDGAPRHPLYIKSDWPLVVWTPR